MMELSQEHFIEILESMSDGFISMDNQLVVSYFNRTAEKLLGRDRKDVLNRNLFDAIPEARGSIFEEKYTEAVRSKTPLSFTTYFEIAPYVNWFDVRVYPSQQGISVFFLVVTDQQDVRAELTETKAMLRAALDQSQAGIAIADASSGKLKYVNKFGLLLCDRSKENSDKGIDIGNLAKGWQIFHHDGTLFKEDEVPLIRAIKYGETCSREFILRRSGDDDFIIWANAAPIFDERGRIIAGVVVFLDITQRKLAEKEIEDNREQLQNAFDHMSQLIQYVILSKDINIRFENSHLEKCYEKMNCDQKDCLCFGTEAKRCWQIAGTFCGGEEQGAHDQKYPNCQMCKVYKDAADGPVNMIGEHFNNMMHILQLKHEELQHALHEIKTLQGIVPICSHCKQIRDDKGFWNKVENYIEQHTEARFTHGVCPDCQREYYPAFFDKKK